MKRTNATQFFSQQSALNELDQIKFAVSSIVSTMPPGSHMKENGENAAKGISARLDYLHDSIAALLDNN